MKKFVQYAGNVNLDLIKKNKKNIIIIVAVISIIILIIFYKYYTNKVKWDQYNPIFFKKTTSAKESYTITPDKFYESSGDKEYTYFYWMYVDNLIHRYGEKKEVFVKGIPKYESNEQSPGVYISSKQNSLEIIISTLNKNDHFIMDDFPIRKWFSIAIVVKNKQVELYMDGLLKITKNLSGFAKLNTGPLEITKNGGYDGLISSISYFPDAKTKTFIQVKHSRGPITLWWLNRILEYIKSIFMKLKSSINIKIDLDIDLDKAIYKKMKKGFPTDSSMSAAGLSDMKHLGKIKYEKALKICDESDKCNSVMKLKNGKKKSKEYTFSLAYIKDISALEYEENVNKTFYIKQDSLTSKISKKLNKAIKKDSKKQASKSKKVLKTGK